MVYFNRQGVLQDSSKPRQKPGAGKLGGVMAKRKILIIDDDLVWHKLLKRLLSKNYDIHAAINCAEGVRMVEEYKPDCILLDFHLQDGDAVSVCSELRRNGKELDTPVVVVSSDAGAEITAYAECRAAYFVLKGSQTMAELPTIVGKLLLNDEVVPCEKEPRIEPSY